LINSRRNKKTLDGLNKNERKTVTRRDRGSVTATVDLVLINRLLWKISLQKTFCRKKIFIITYSLVTIRQNFFLLSFCKTFFRLLKIWRYYLNSFKFYFYLFNGQILKIVQDSSGSDKYLSDYYLYKLSAFFLFKPSIKAPVARSANERFSFVLNIPGPEYAVNYIVGYRWMNEWMNL